MKVTKPPERDRIKLTSRGQQISPGLVASVRICMLEIRDSSTSKWLSPSRNRYLEVTVQHKLV